MPFDDSFSIPPAVAPESQCPVGNRIQLGNSDLWVSRIGLGCWPMSGISSLGIEDQQSIATIQTALDLGINFFDTAYSYGYDGRSDRVLGQALRGRRSQAIIAHKVGMHWDSDRQRVLDGRPETLMEHAQQCLHRLGVEYVDVMYLHSPDPNTPIEESAGAIREICQRGWARFAAVSNVNADQAKRFADECPIVAIQPYFNMFQQEAVEELRPFADSNQVSLVCYWVLMKGLLSGHLQRDHHFEPNDRRLTYPIFRGEAWQKAQDLLDQLRKLSAELGCTVAQLVTAWSLRHPNVSVALVGAKTPVQIEESAKAMNLILDDDVITKIDQWLT
jgi:aryl-alcohol dehydrogenase-like predicted oxidoreductase